MQGKRFIREIYLKNFLSYGSEGQRIELEPLNVLIGPNASGKSNLIEAFRLLQATASDLTLPIRNGGGASEWLWKGLDNSTASMEMVVEYPSGEIPLRYRLGFTSIRERLQVVEEVIENEHLVGDKYDFFYSYKDGNDAFIKSNTITIYSVPVDNGDVPVGGGGKKTKVSDRKLQNEGSDGRDIDQIPVQDLNLQQSIISQEKSNRHYPEVAYLGNQFGNIRIYANWSTETPRKPQRTDDPSDFLLENISNLGLIINDLQHQGKKKLLVDKLQKLYDLVDDVTAKVYSGHIELFLHEKGFQQPIPATRLSDGVLRYLSLLAILLHPTPPPLICIDEPEVGLHPDVLPTIAELLIEASQRTQLIVTTHSESLIASLTQPEMVLICERNEAGTQLQRLETEQLKEWLEDYTLGDLWRMGEIGGTRW